MTWTPDLPPVPVRERALRELEEELNSILKITRYGGPIDASYLVDIQRHTRRALTNVKVLKGDA